MASQPNEVDALLSDLRSLYGDTRKAAISKLAELPVSSRRVVEALITVKNTDYRDDVREAAAHALEAPVHQEFLRQNPGLLTSLVTAVPAQSSEAWGQSSGWRTSSAPTMTWQEIWIAAVTQPSVETYERITDNPDATPSRARKWLFFTALVTVPVTLVAVSTLDPRRFGRIGISSLTPILLILTPLFAGLSVLGGMLSALFLHWGAKLLGGDGEYDKIFFATAAISCAIAIPSVILQAVPALSLLSLLLSIYTLILEVIAIRAVYKLGVGASCLATIAVPIVIVIVVALIALVFRR